MSSAFFSQIPFLYDYNENPYDFSLNPRKQSFENDFKVKYKTEICRNWELGSCEFGDNCAFAHGHEELRNKSNLGSRYKTKKCKQFHELGYCIYGNRCQFKHTDISADTASSSPRSAETNRKYSDDFSKRRLKIFVEIEKKGEFLL